MVEELTTPAVAVTLIGVMVAGGSDSGGVGLPVRIDGRVGTDGTLADRSRAPSKLKAGELRPLAEIGGSIDSRGGVALAVGFGTVTGGFGLVGGRPSGSPVTT